ncbi:MAG: hypothetical protein K2H46_09735 [Muribaculaceae bacterium]|nr:hypothetical protein [Muribaculaceae bacterium]
MQILSNAEMINLSGGYNTVLCAALQNYANRYGERMTTQQWEEWDKAWFENCVD